MGDQTFGKMAMFRPQFKHDISQSQTTTDGLTSQNSHRWNTLMRKDGVPERLMRLGVFRRHWSHFCG